MNLTSTPILVSRFPSAAWPAVGNRPQPVSQAPVQPAPVRFAGVGDMVSSFISLIDRSRPMELIGSDVSGMVAPRTGVAAAFRGPDDARETLIREVAGLFCVTMLAGLSNQLMIRGLGNRVGIYNPHGTPAKAWIGAKNLRVFSDLYAQSLNAPDTRNAQEARTAFITRILNGLESGDKKLSINGRLTVLKTLAEKEPNDETAKKALSQMVREVHGPSVSNSTQEKYGKLFRAGQMDALREAFLNNGWGKLSQEGKAELLKAFQQKGSNAPKEAGLFSVDQVAWNRVNEMETVLKNDSASKVRQSAFLKQRLQTSLKQLQDEAPEFIKKVDRVALDHGLTSVVNINGSEPGKGALLTSGQSRQTMLSELKAFLDHYVDRAGFEVKEAVKAKGSAGLGWKEQRELLHTRLFAPSAKGLCKLLPQAKDGLVIATLKTKTAYTLVPITMAILANGATTFMNNYITRKKYHGRDIFPGEETYLSRQQSAPKAIAQSTRIGRLA